METHLYNFRIANEVAYSTDTDRVSANRIDRKERICYRESRENEFPQSPVLDDHSDTRIHHEYPSDESLSMK